MRFKAVDWITARNRNTGHIRFLHHAKWGFDWQVAFDPSKLPKAPSDPGGPIVIDELPVFPEPEGKNDEIEHGPGKGAHEPSMTEAVFNDAAKLVKS